MPKGQRAHCVLFVSLLFNYSVHLSSSDDETLMPACNLLPSRCGGARRRESAHVGGSWEQSNLLLRLYGGGPRRSTRSQTNPLILDDDDEVPEQEEADVWQDGWEEDPIAALQADASRAEEQTAGFWSSDAPAAGQEKNGGLPAELEASDEGDLYDIKAPNKISWRGGKKKTGRKAAKKPATMSANALRKARMRLEKEVEDPSADKRDRKRKEDDDNSDEEGGSMDEDMSFSGSDGADIPSSELLREVDEEDEWMLSIQTRFHRARNRRYAPLERPAEEREGEFTALELLLRKDEEASTQLSGSLLLALGGFTGPLKGSTVIRDVERLCPAQTSEPTEWIGAPDLLTPRSAFAVAAVDGRVYALGGQENEGGYKPEYTDLRSVESLQISPMRGDRWREEPAMSTVRMGHSAAGIGGRVLVMGGYDGFMVMKSCESYGSGDDSWREEVSMLERRHGFGSAVCRDQLWAYGGYNWSHCLNSGERLDVGAGRWVAAPPMIEKRHWHALVGMQATNRVYALGGWSMEVVKEWDPDARSLFSKFTHRQLLLTHVESMDPREGRWVPEAPMGTRRMYFAAAGAGNYLYAMGGCDTDGCATNSVERLDVRMGSWTECPPLQINRTYFSAVTIDL